ncbi:medium-chain acyl-CoA ligase ACSF2, mitochondrial-like isoform X2 [Cylas formicarius]|uniref:medium-chain acyl-CoA ligase ACSF2, mitochondrial-like isoform X2 n=1 Tax=Cylas formicarius TaxID=197179 RepID=UPI002958AFAD|nr:medium-chain acyl-CoA ligase ACSF2, mitochondrial-like isoform X2 [Cylas formicarius]
MSGFVSVCQFSVSSAEMTTYSYRMVSFSLNIWSRNVNSSRKYAKLSYIHNVGKEPLRPLTIGQLLEQASKTYGDRAALISRHQRKKLSFEDVLDRADRLAAGLTTAGLTYGDRVGLWAPNTEEWYTTYMACARAGLLLVNINPAYQAKEIEYCINKVGIKSIVCPHKYKSQNYYDILNTVSDEVFQSEPGKLECKIMPSLKSVIVTTEETLGGAYTYNEIMALASTNSIQKIKSNQHLIQSDEPCHIQFTSGTTGHPKAAIQSHFQIVNNSYFIGKRNELDRKHHTICVQVPFFHVYGTVATIAAGLNHGATLVLPSAGYDPDKSLDAIRDAKCTVIHGTPTMYVDLVHKQVERKEQINPEIAISGGASCPPQLLKDMKNILKVDKVKSVFGLTETTAVVFQSLLTDDEYLSTSTVGYPHDHIEAKVVDPEGRIVPRGSPGELWTRGYSNIPGYWNDPDKTAELIGPDRWLKTGDQFVIEENGYGRVVGRLKEMIIRGGENIFPKEIEDFLITHPDILEVHACHMSVSAKRSVRA